MHFRAWSYSRSAGSVLERMSASAHALHCLVLGKFGLVWSGAIFARPETRWSGPWQNFWDQDQDHQWLPILVWSWSRPTPAFLFYFYFSSYHAHKRHKGVIDERPALLCSTSPAYFLCMLASESQPSCCSMLSQNKQMGGKGWPTASEMLQQKCYVP